MALPDEYYPLVQIWNVTTNIIAEKAKNMLLEEERRRRGTEELVNSHNGELETAMAARRFRNRKEYQEHIQSKQRGPRQQLNCWHCGKEGHKEQNCFEKFPELRKQFESQAELTNFAYDVEDDDLGL